jgi:cyanophycinase-like exopeptidase
LEFADHHFQSRHRVGKMPMAIRGEQADKV